MTELQLINKLTVNIKTIEYIYSANGQMLQKKASNKTTHYSGNFIYEGNSLKQILHSEGYIDMSVSPTYHYYLKDHLGNNRMVVNQVGTVFQQTDYYPFGMAFNEYSNVDNKYLYNGKEMQNDAIGNGLLDWYDYGARMYDPAIGRWHAVDPLAEKYAGVSSFAYVGNNPIKFVDPDGMQYGDPDSGGTPAKFDEKTGNLTEAQSSIRPVLDSNNPRYEKKTTSENIVGSKKPSNGTITQGLSPYERSYKTISPEWSRPLVESKLMQSIGIGVFATAIVVTAVETAPAIALAITQEAGLATAAVQSGVISLETTTVASFITGVAYGVVTSGDVINLPPDSPSPIANPVFQLGTAVGNAFSFFNSQNINRQQVPQTDTSERVEVKKKNP